MASAGWTLRERLTGAQRCVHVGERAAAGAQKGAGIWGGHRAWDGDRSRAHVLLMEILKKVPASSRGLWAAAECEHPAQLDVEEGVQPWGHVQSLEFIRAVGDHLAEPGTAQVLEGGGGVAGTDHLHTAFGRCGTHHGIELLVLQPSGSNTWLCKKKKNRQSYKNNSSHIVT